MAGMLARGAVVLAGTLLASGCWVEVSTSGSGGTLRSADELASIIEQQFQAQVASSTGATAEVDCPSGLSGESGNRFLCSGRTSDGFALEISISEQGAGDFRWLITDSPRIGASEG